MMTHIEGPIVDAFYDMSLLSWSEPLQPPLPLLQGRPSDNGDHKFGKENLYVNGNLFIITGKHITDLFRRCFPSRRGRD